MIKYIRYMMRPGSDVIERFEFDTFKKAHRFECKKLFDGWTGVSSPGLPDEIEVECYEQLSLFDSDY